MDQNYFRKADSLSTGQQIPRTLEPLMFVAVSTTALTIPFRPILQRSRPISVFPFYCFQYSAWLKCQIAFIFETIRRCPCGHCVTVPTFILASLLIDQML
jgi:hypothetical protein